MPLFNIECLRNGRR